MARGLKARILAILLGLIIGLGLAELALRVSGFSSPVFETFDEVRGKSLIPDMEGWYRGQEGEAYIRINSAGFRDVEHSARKAPGVYRIAILGDSYAEARQVSLENTFWKKLEEYLNHSNDSRAGGVPDVEVLNFGVSGFSTTQELLTLRDHVWPFHPDLVLLLFFHANDLAENFPHRGLSPEEYWKVPAPFYYLSDGDLKFHPLEGDAAPRMWWRRLTLGLVHSSRVLEALNQAFRVRQSWVAGHSESLSDGLSTFQYRPPGNPEDEQAWQLTERLLAKFYGEVRTHGARFLLATVTSPHQVDPEQRRPLQARLGVEALDYPERRLTRFAQQEGFPIVVLVHEFQEYAEKGRVYLHGFPNTRMGYGHWNERGHELAARILAREIMKLDLLQPAG